jgi:transcriptional regulator with XRE-family HTH domain
MPSLRKHFGNRLRSIRHERELTQGQFVKLVEISVDFLSLIERGVKAPSFEVLELMGGRLHLPVREFFDFRRRTDHSKP